MEFRVVELQNNRIVVQHNDCKYYEMAIIASVTDTEDNEGQETALVNDIKSDVRFIGHGSIEFLRDWIHTQYDGLIVFDISEIDSVYSTIWRSKLSELGFTDDGNDRWSE